MAKKKKTKKSVETRTPGTPPPPSETASTSGNPGRWVAIALLVLGTGVFLYASMSGDRKPSSSSASHDHGTEPVARRDRGQSERFRYFEDPAAAHPLPVTLPPSRFQNQGIAHTYEIAKEIPEVLAQQPCLCGCDNTSDDHRSLLDCYIDEHASTCMVCMKEAVLAEQMTEAGESAKAIREAILRHDFSDASIGN